MKAFTLDGRPITAEDIVVLMTHFAIKNKDADMEKALDYYILLAEPGHNRCWLKEHFVMTRNEKEAIVR